MNTGKKYKTKQKESILQCIQQQGENYVTIQQIDAFLKARGEKVGLTTIYRNLDKLVEEKRITKVNIDGIKGCCYRYLKEEENILFNLKCEKCGQLVDVQCPELAHLYEHVSKDHHINIDPGRTMFYGTCEECVEKEENDSKNKSNS